MSDPESAPRAVVVGGGLAGLAAAVRLADAGAAVTLLEARPRLGGATSSFRRGDLTVDTGQHALLRCYSAYLGFLDRLGVSDGIALQPRFSVPVLDPGHTAARLQRVDLPAPLHLAPALLRYRLLSPAGRLRAVRAALALRRLDPDDPDLDQRSFAEWLTAHGQDRAAVDALWGLFTVAALNAAPAGASLALATKVFSTGLLTSTTASDMGLPRIPLGDLHGAAAARALAGCGSQVRLRAKASEVRRAGERFEVVIDDEVLSADAVVLAVPHPAAAALVPAGAAPERDRWAGLGEDPIVNVHVVYARPVTDLPFAAAVGSPVQWVFDRTRVAGGQGQYLAVSLSAASEYVDTPTERLREVFLPALRELFPAARATPVTDFFVTRERRATFHQAPGTRALRPPAATRWPGLLLAGAWTDTGWPDTMEGAVRSGNEAARLAGQHLSGLARSGTDERTVGVIA